MESIRTTGQVVEIQSNAEAPVFWTTLYM